MLVKSKEDITLVPVNLYKILSWNKYYNMTILLRLSKILVIYWEVIFTVLG